MTTPARLQIVPHPADQPGPAVTGWDLPVPLTTTTVPPPFPVEVLPPWLGDMVTATARFTQTDPAMAGGVAGFPSGFAAAKSVQVGDGLFEEPARGAEA